MFGSVEFFHRYNELDNSSHHLMRRSCTAGELRLRLVDPKRFNPSTVMPSYVTRDGLHRVVPEYRGRSIHSAGEIEDVVAYLPTLSGE